jgi:hypothetical protein
MRNRPAPAIAATAAAFRPAAFTTNRLWSVNPGVVTIQKSLSERSPSTGQSVCSVTPARTALSARPKHAS